MQRGRQDQPAPSGAGALTRGVQAAGHQQSHQGSQLHKRPQSSPAAARVCKRQHLPRSLAAGQAEALDRHNSDAAAAAAGSSSGGPGDDRDRSSGRSSNRPGSRSTNAWGPDLQGVKLGCSNCRHSLRGCGTCRAKARAELAAQQQQQEFLEGNAQQAPTGISRGIIRKSSSPIMPAAWGPGACLEQPRIAQPARSAVPGNIDAPQHSSGAHTGVTAQAIATAAASMHHPGGTNVGSTLTAERTTCLAGPSALTPHEDGTDGPAPTMAEEASAATKVPLGAAAQSGPVFGSNQGQQIIDQLIQQPSDARNDPQAAQRLLPFLFQAHAAVHEVVPSQTPVAIEGHYKTAEALNRVNQVYDEYKSKYTKLPFDLTELARYMLNGESVDTTSPTQTRKSSTIAGSGLVAAAAGVPSVVIVCESNANTKALVTKLNTEYFEKLNALESMKGAMMQDGSTGIKLQAVFAGKAHVLKDLVKGKDCGRVLSGQTTLVVSYTPQQINRIRTELVEYTRLPILLTIDEADKMWSTVPTLNDNPLQGGKIQRERAFYSLVTCLKRPDNVVMPEDTMVIDSAESSSRSALVQRFPALVALHQISATPVDMLRWHMGKELPMRFLAPSELDDNYCGVKDLKPFEDQKGQPVFLAPNDVCKATNYGLDLPKRKLSAKAEQHQTAAAAGGGPSTSSAAESGAQPAKTLINRFYDHVAAAVAAGQEGLLLLDITCPGVNVEASTINRAKQLAVMYPGFVFLVVTGKGVQEVLGKKGSDGKVDIKTRQVGDFVRRIQIAIRKSNRQQAADIEAAESAAAAAVAAAAQERSAADVAEQLESGVFGDARDSVDDEQLGAAAATTTTTTTTAVIAGENDDEPEDLMESKLADVLRNYDTSLKTPVVVLGYAMTRRSLSIRSDKRVPTHIICAPSIGTSMADLLQMMGRGTGNLRSVLDEHGFDCVRVLCREDDYQSMQLYYEFVHYLYSARADGSIDGLVKTLEDVPEKYRKILGHKLRQGQRDLNSAKVLDRLNQYAQLEGAAPAIACRAKRDQDGRLGGRRHELMMYFACVSRQLGKEQLSHEELFRQPSQKSDRQQEMHDNIIKVGHRSAFRDLRRFGMLTQCTTAQGKPMHGWHELTAAGREYVELFDDEVPDADQ